MHEKMMFFIAFSMFLLSLTPSFALSTGWLSPTNATAPFFWTDIGNIYSSNDQYASVSHIEVSMYAKNFSVESSVPYGYVIDNVIVNLESYETDSYTEEMMVTCNGGTAYSPIAYGSSIGAPDRNTSFDFSNKDCTQGSDTSNPPTTTSLDDVNRWTRNRLNNASFHVRIMSEVSGGGFDPNSKISIFSASKLIDRLMGDLIVGNKVLGWNWTSGFVIANIKNVTIFPNSTMYKIITEYPESQQKLCDYFKKLGLVNETKYAEYGLNTSKCHKDIAVSWNHPLWLPNKQQKVMAKDVTTGDYLSGLYFNISTFNITKLSSSLQLIPSKIVKIISYTGNSIDIKSDADFIFAHDVMVYWSKTTSYVDWVAVNVTYSLDTWVIDNLQLGASSDLTITNSEDANGRGLSTSGQYPVNAKASAGTKWFGENWIFIMGNSSGSGTISNVTAIIYNIYADSNPASDTFAIQCSNDDGATWGYTLWSGTALWTSATNKTYDIYTNCGVDTWGEINTTRIRLTSTLKSGGEDSVTWYVDAIYLNITGADTQAPQYSNNQTNNTMAGQPANFTLDWTDNLALSGYIFSTNNSGTWKNSSFISFSGTSNTSWNVTTLNSTVGALVQWKFYANDTTNNMNTSLTYNLTITTDAIPPTFNNCHQNVTNNTAVNIGTPIYLGCQWNDNVRLSMHVNSSKINDTGSWTNGTWTTFTAGNWSNFTIIFPSQQSSNLTIKIYANDTSNNQNVSGIWFWYNTSAIIPPIVEINIYNCVKLSKAGFYYCDGINDIFILLKNQFLYNKNLVCNKYNDVEILCGNKRLRFVNGQKKDWLDGFIDLLFNY